MNCCESNLFIELILLKVADEMKSLWLWGAGKNLEVVMNYIQSGITIKGIFDKNTELCGKRIQGIEVMIPRKELLTGNDVILITASAYEEIVRDAESILRDCRVRIVPFWNAEYGIEEICDLIDANMWKSEIEVPYLKAKIKNLQLKLDNREYEVAEKIINSPPSFPIIRDGIEALDRVYSEGKSLCRYGDGEFEIIFGRERPFFQSCRTGLQERLKEVLINQDDNVITCIADNYGCLNKYTDAAAHTIRTYMTPDIRKNHIQVLDPTKEYYDAYISRPYIIYKDKTKASQVFALWKKLWRNRDIVIVEGRLSRNGYGNDLFQECSSVRRILCPAENAWDFYYEIYQYIVENVELDNLLLIALGPAATVLAYDLAVEGYQAIDIGHLDNEYEWYLRGVKERVDICYKYVAECWNGTQVEEINDDEYESQIIQYIGCDK